MKILAASTAFAVCLFVGLGRLHQLNDRLNIMEEVLSICKELTHLMAEQRYPLDEALKKAAAGRRLAAELDAISDGGLAECGTRIAILWEKVMGQSETLSILSIDQRREVLRLGESLAAASAEQLKSGMEYCYRNIEALLHDAKEERSVKGRASVWLGVLGGAAMFIILV